MTDLLQFEELDMVLQKEYGMTIDLENEQLTLGELFAAFRRRNKAHVERTPRRPAPDPRRRKGA
ncbi:MAG: hypothetical protein AAGF12_16480 [Myxococcota bacterium]